MAGMRSGLLGEKAKGQLEPWGETGLVLPGEARAPQGSPISKSREIRGGNKHC